MTLSPKQEMTRAWSARWLSVPKVITLSWHPTEGPSMCTPGRLFTSSTNSQRLVQHLKCLPRRISTSTVSPSAIRCMWPVWVSETSVRWRSGRRSRGWGSTEPWTRWSKGTNCASWCPGIWSSGGRRRKLTRQRWRRWMTPVFSGTSAFRLLPAVAENLTCAALITMGETFMCWMPRQSAST